jgi:hypothetical protein
VTTQTIDQGRTDHPRSDHSPSDQTRSDQARSDQARSDQARSDQGRPASGIWPTIRSYVLWQHERGTLHYDIMVTLILIFVFFSPHVIDFNDKPAPANPHPTGVIVSSDGNGGLVYEISASKISAASDTAINDELRHVIEPISGKVAIVKYEKISDLSGRVQAYRVWVTRQP